MTRARKRMILGHPIHFSDKSRDSSCIAHRSSPPFLELGSTSSLIEQSLESEEIVLIGCRIKQIPHEPNAARFTHRLEDIVEVEDDVLGQLERGVNRQCNRAAEFVGPARFECHASTGGVAAADPQQGSTRTKVHN